MSVLDRAALDLGSGHEARWLWRTDLPTRPPLPFGILEVHGPATDRCQTVLRWADPAPPDLNVRDLFALESLDPLTIGDLIGCPRCNVEGRIEGSLWRPLPVDDGTLARP